MEAILGRKLGMTQVFSANGEARGVAVVEAGPCVVLQIKTEQNDGYNAIQLGFGARKHINKPMAGHMKRQGQFRWLDIGSITDGACIAGIDPCVSTEHPRRADLFQTSPRWFKYCDPATYDARRRNKYEVHFDYLRSFEESGRYERVELRYSSRRVTRSGTRTEFEFVAHVRPAA